MITIDWSENEYSILVYLDRDVNEDDRELYSIVTAEILADFPNINKVNESIEKSDLKLVDLKRLQFSVFQRVENQQ